MSNRTNFENQTHAMVEKIDSKAPVYSKLCSSIIKKYMSIGNNFWNLYYSNQKKVFGTSEMGDETFTIFDDYVSELTKICLLQIDVAENMFKNYVDYRLATLNFYEKMSNVYLNNLFMFTKFNES